MLCGDGRNGAVKHGEGGEIAGLDCPLNGEGWV